MQSNWYNRPNYIKIDMTLSSSSPLQGLKGFAASQPPLLVFTICILAFGVSTIMLAFIVRSSDLPNPDIDMVNQRKTNLIKITQPTH